jgi:hypothetical protein
LSPGETASVPFSVDVDAVENWTRRTREELGSQPGQVQVSVRATARYTATVDGECVDRTVEYSMPLEIDGGTHWVQDPDTASERHGATRTVIVKNEPGLLGGIGGPLTLLVALAGLSAVARYREAFGLKPAEREWLAFRADRSEFDEWVVRMRLLTRRKTSRGRRPKRWPTSWTSPSTPTTP